mgnify:CR=1 FL=1|tara:strand:+ start:42 stop:185 length:144 start_codon:yes stop_codon:yes gene_type:complete
MAELTKFKELSISDIANRPSYDLTSNESTQASSILTNFFTYFKAKHS